LSQKWTQGSLREELARRKYRKYQEGRYSSDALGSEDLQASSSRQGGSSESADPKADNLERRTTAQATLERGRRRVKNLIKQKKGQTRRDEDVEIDILFENQRGAFFFGIPLFSSNSLLNFDPTAWETPVITHTAPDTKPRDALKPEKHKKWEKKMDSAKLQATLHPSAVNITNAQLPSPLWEWSWPRWYVDMSGDVDEEGWSYSFAFWKPSASWHGTHPWFHSFVRRRRWLRKRVRKHHRSPTEGKTGPKDAHRLNAEYFTIHSSRDRSPDSSIGTSTIKSEGFGVTSEDEAVLDDLEDIKDLATLMMRLKRAKVDRQKIVAVRGFVEHGEAGELGLLKDYVGHPGFPATASANDRQIDASHHEPARLSKFPPPALSQPNANLRLDPITS